MNNEKVNSAVKREDRSFGFRLKLDMRRNWELYLIFLPVLAYYIMFHYAPMAMVVSPEAAISVNSAPPPEVPANSFFELILHQSSTISPCSLMNCALVGLQESYRRRLICRTLFHWL